MAKRPRVARAEDADQLGDRCRRLVAEMESAREYPAEAAMLEFASALNDAMSAHQISRAELARRIGASPAYVTKVLRGDANLTIATMAKLAGATGHALRLGLEAGSAGDDPTPERTR
jgi:ribosome-binding protein aMBF1 (putative translation factor)